MSGEPAQLLGVEGKLFVQEKLNQTPEQEAELRARRSAGQDEGVVLRPSAGPFEIRLPKHKRVNKARVRDWEESEAEMNEAQTMKRILDAFDNDGNTTALGDPYRDNPRTPLAALMFNEAGDLTWEATGALTEIVAKRPVKPMCLAVRILVAADFASNTKGNYSTIYLWR